MLRSLYTAATGMEAQQLQLDTIANNLANTGTTGFKAVRAEFADLLSDTLRGSLAPDPRGGTPPSPLQVGLGVQTGTTTRFFTQGNLVATQNQLDLAIQGNGFFRIQRFDGSWAYTRAGNFRVDATGRLVDQAGEVLDPGITIPPNTTQVTVQPDGTVFTTVPGSTKSQQVGVIQLHTFPNPSGLEAVGGNLYVETEGSGQEIILRPGDQGAGTINQGYLENSNVQAVNEMINMINVQRAYELNSKVVQTSDQMLQRLTSLR